MAAKLQGLLVLCCFCGLSCVPGEDFFEEGGLLQEMKRLNDTQDKMASAKWMHLEKTISGMLDEVMRRALPTMIRASGQAGLSDKCQASLVELIFGIRNLKSWAFRILDAAGKPPGGILDGTLTALGSYDECLKVRVPDKYDPNLTTFQGKYCTVEVKLPLPPKPEYLTVHFRNTFLQNKTNRESIWHDVYDLSHFFYLFSYRMGICVPSTCNEADVLKMGNLLVNKLSLGISVPRCEVEEPLKLTTSQIIIVCLFGFLISLVIMGTIADVVYEKFLKDRPQEMHFERNPAFRILSCFSLSSNIPKLFSSSTSIEDVRFLHGMRAISLCWLILGGVFMLINYQLLKQSSKAIAISKSVLMQTVLSHSLSIDTMFFTTAYLTGMKVAANYFKFWDFVNLLMHKILRTTPVHMFMVCVVILLPLLTRGPLWDETLTPTHDKCTQYWWTNLLYINNIIPNAENRCIPNSWYLSAELQLFILGLIFSAMWCTSQRNLGVLLACGAVLVSIVTTGVVTSYFSYPPIALFAHVDLPARNRIEDALQQKFYPHIPTWLAGLALGFYQKKRRDLTIKPYVLAAGWVATFTCMTAVVFGIYEWNRHYWMNVHLSALYSAAHRPVWALCITWVAFVCGNGNARTIASMLSWSGFLLLSRLNLFMYLTSALMQTVTVAHLRERLQASGFMSLFMFSGVFMLSAIASVAFCLLVELPIIELKKLVDSHFRRKWPAVRKSFSAGSEQTKMATLAVRTSKEDPPKSPRKFKKRDSCQPLNLDEIMQEIDAQDSRNRK